MNTLRNVITAAALVAAGCGASANATVMLDPFHGRPLTIGPRHCHFHTERVFWHYNNKWAYLILRVDRSCRRRLVRVIPIFGHH